MKKPDTFSYSFTLGSGPVTAPGPALFAVDSLSEHPLPNGMVLARNRRNGRQMVLPAEVAVAMSYCNEFRSLEDHVRALLDSGEPEKEAAIRSVVKTVHDGGLVITAKEVCDRLEPPTSLAAKTEKPIVCIITWERPQALERLLESMLSNCDPGGVEKCIVVDDSRSTDAIRQNRRISAIARKNAAFSIEYFGAQEAQELLAGLIRQLPKQEESIRFLLDRKRWKDHWTAGIARNYCQILSVSKPLIVMDDDVVCDVFEAPLKQSGVEFSDRQRETVYFKSPDEWPQPAAGGSRDPIARHMQCLGLTIPQALLAMGKTRPEETALRHAQAGISERLHACSQVLVTQCGSLGDPGTGDNKWLATLPTDSRNHLLAYDPTLQVAMTGRNCWRGAALPIFAPRSNMSQIVGTDNRDFLPPYFPILRGQDGKFGQMCQFIFQNSVALDLPWAVPHIPVVARSWEEKDNEFRKSPGFPGKLSAPGHRLNETCLSQDPRIRLEALAQYYLDLSSSPDHKLLAAYADDWHQSWSGDLAALNEVRQACEESPQKWRDYLDNAIRQLSTSRLPELSVPELEGSGFDLRGEALAQFWRKTWSGFGRALLAWRDMREAAREILGRKHS